MSCDQDCLNRHIKTRYYTSHYIYKNLTREITFRSERWISSVVRSRLLRSNDVESNPGPKESTLLVTSYNVRGLNDEKKLRHLINKVYQDDKGKNFDNIVCLQETYITGEGKLPYIWRGNMHLTPGTGNSCGCITLTSPHLNIIHAVNLENRAHVLVCQRTGDLSPTYVVANIYAPNPNNREKISFFELVFDTVNELSERFNCSNILIMGDFNLILTEKEAKNRIYTAQEKRVADCVRDQFVEMGLEDCWVNKKAYTWRRPNSNIFSTIDRLLYSKNNLVLNEVKVNWSYGFSDHAALVAGLAMKDKTPLTRSKITRLDPTLAKDPYYKELIEAGFNTMYATTQSTWNPHLKLEYAKVCIRTVVEGVQAERKRKEIGEECMLNQELEASINKLSEGSTNNIESLIDHIEELRTRKQVLIDERGARLAERLGTKWFNEGEKSSKYFMRLLNRATPDSFEVLEGNNGVEERNLIGLRKSLSTSTKICMRKGPTLQ